MPEYDQFVDEEVLTMRQEAEFLEMHGDGPDDPAVDVDDSCGMTDMEADADVLASAGMGTDEDYGYFGE